MANKTFFERGLVALLALILGCASMPAAVLAEDPVTRILFSDGERFAGQNVSQEGVETAIEALPGSLRMILYVKRTCKDCIAEYDSYELLGRLFAGDAVVPTFLWQNEFPEGDLVLPEAMCYLVGENLRLGDWVPTYFFTDGEGLILKKTIELPEAIAYLGETLSPEQKIGMLADFLARGNRVLLISEEEPSQEMKEEAEELAEKTGGEVMTVGLEKGLAWADFGDTAGIFSMLTGMSASVALVSVDGEQLELMER